MIHALPSAHYLNVDLTDIVALRAGVAAARKAHGPVNVLVNNAAHDERHRTEEMTPEYWDDRIAVNLKHQFFAAQAVLPDMKAANAGAIINFGSVSWMVGQGGMAAYTASKSGVLGLTRSLAVSFQEVVHSVLSEEAEVAEASDFRGRTEWTLTRMRL